MYTDPQITGKSQWMLLLRQQGSHWLVMNFHLSNLGHIWASDPEGRGATSHNLLPARRVPSLCFIRLICHKTPLDQCTSGWTCSQKTVIIFNEVNIYWTIPSRAIPEKAHENSLGETNVKYSVTADQPDSSPSLPPSLSLNCARTQTIVHGTLARKGSYSKTEEFLM